MSSLNQELLRLTKNLSGIVKMDKLPGALFVIDPHRENIAVREANKLNIPVITIIKAPLIATIDLSSFSIICLLDSVVRPFLAMIFISFGPEIFSLLCLKYSLIILFILLRSTAFPTFFDATKPSLKQSCFI